LQRLPSAQGFRNYSFDDGAMGREYLHTGGHKQ
jgi:hypothetical protein